jgi:tetratricopeptide (TPR) repeat protein
LPQLSVRSFSAVAHFKDKEVNPQASGNELKVRAVLTGRLVRRGDEFAISAELVDVRGNRQIWGSQYQRKVDDILAMQEEISREISENLRLQMTGADKQRLNRRQTVDSAAYQLYLQGRYQWNKRTLEGLQQSIDYFQQAILKDPQYALAFAGQADAYALLADFNVLPAREVLPKVKSAAQKALDLDGTLAEAHTSLGWSQFHDLDWTGAEKEFKRAIELNASYPTAHSWYGEYLMAQGRFDRAQEEMTRAYQLDTLSPVLNLALGYRFYYAHQYAQAIEQCQKVLAMDPNFAPAHVCLGRAYQQKPAFPEAIAEFRKALDISEGDTNELAASGQAYAVSHQEGAARTILDQLKERSQQTYVQPMWIAAIHVGLGEKDQAFDWMQRAYDDRSAWLVYLKVDPLFDPVRGDARFADLLRRVGLAGSN